MTPKIGQLPGKYSHPMPICSLKLVYLRGQIYKKKILSPQSYGIVSNSNIFVDCFVYNMLNLLFRLTHRPIRS